MELLERLEDKYRAKEATIDQEIPATERANWALHPCTQRLIACLTADVLGMLQQWAGGAHMKPTTEETALATTKLLAMCQTTQQILVKIEEIKSGEDAETDSFGS